MRSEFKKTLRRAAMFGGVVVAQIIGNIALYVLANPTRGEEFFVLSAFFATLSCPALLATWVTLGRGAISIRLPRSLLLLAVWHLTPLLALPPWSPATGLPSAQLFIAAAVFAATLLACGAMRMFFGWKLARVGERKSAERLSVRELLLQTAGFAIVFALARWIDLKEYRLERLLERDFLLLTAIIAALAAGTVPSGVAAILSRPNARNVILLCGSTIAIRAVSEIVLMNTMRGPGPLPNSMFAFTLALVMCLFLFRGAGIRLVRNRDQASTTSDGVLATQSDAIPHAS